MKLLIVLGLFPLFSASPFRTARMAESLISSLEAAAANPAAAKAIDRIFTSENTCLNTIDEAIEALRESSELMAAAEGDLQALNQRVESMRYLRGETDMVRGVAAIFRDLQPLLQKLSPAVAASKVCSSSTENTFEYLRGLSVVMHEFSYDSQVAPNRQSRDMFHKAGKILTSLVNFLSQLQYQSKEFGNFCYPNKESTVRGLRALADMIGNLGDMFSAVGNVRAGQEIRKGQMFTDKIANQIPLMNDLDVGFQDCSIKDLSSAARTMEDLADLVDEVGIERLGNDLGIDITQFYI
jgi:hypothetical protein